MKQNLDNLLWLGTVVNTHGLKGEVRVLSDSDNLEERFKKGSIIKYINEEKDGELVVKSIRFHKKFILLTFEDHSHINDIEWLKGSKIYCDKEELKDGEYYLSELINKEITNQDGITIGIVTSIFDQGPYKSMVIKLENGKTTNIPMVDEFKIEFNGTIIKTTIPNELLK